MDVDSIVARSLAKASSTKINDHAYSAALTARSTRPIAARGSSAFTGWGAVPGLPYPIPAEDALGEGLDPIRAAVVSE
jgi:hypothetical protein